MLTPSAICFVGIIVIVKETPYFMIKLMNCQSIIAQLNYIHQFNYGANLSKEK
jgi:hypothetical protein